MPENIVVPSDLMLPAHAAKRAGISKTAVYKMIRAARVQTRRFGDADMVSLSDVENARKSVKR
jgi:hypothetical protein